MTPTLITPPTIAAAARAPRRASFYESARPSRLRPAPKARGGSAESHRDTASLDTLRRQTQHLDRNNTLARGLKAAVVDLVVCDGFPLQFHTSDKAWNRLAEDTLNTYFGWPSAGRKAARQNAALSEGSSLDPGVMEALSGRIDIRGLSCIDDFAAEIVGAALIDGDLSFIKTMSAGMPALQAVEAERLRNPLGPMNTELFAGGVETDAAGRPVRFHFSEWTALGQLDFGSTRPVPAESVLFLRNPMRALTGSMRGEPHLCAAIERLERLGKYDRAVMVAAELQASMAGFIKSTNPEALQASMAGETVDRTGDTENPSERWVEVQPGMFKYLGPMEEVQYPPPSHPIANYGDYVQMQLIQVCADLRLPVSAALLDGRGLNLSTIRSILQVSWRNTKRWQAWLTRAFYTPVTLWATAALIRGGYLPFHEEWRAHSWGAPPPPVMDPKTEIEAGMAAINGCLTSRKRFMQEVLGRDFDEEMEQIAAEQKLMKELGIQPVGMPGQAMGGAGSESASQPNSESASQPGSESGQGQDGSGGGSGGGTPPGSEEN